MVAIILKEQITQKFKFASSFTNPHVGPNLYFHFWVNYAINKGSSVRMSCLN